MPTSYITLSRLKKQALGWIEKAGSAGIETRRIPNDVSSSLWRDGLIIRRGNVWVAVKR